MRKQQQQQQQQEPQKRVLALSGAAQLAAQQAQKERDEQILKYAGFEALGTATAIRKAEQELYRRHEQALQVRGNSGMMRFQTRKWPADTVLHTPDLRCSPAGEGSARIGRPIVDSGERCARGHVGYATRQSSQAYQ